MEFINTSLWLKSLGIQGDTRVDRLRESYMSFRKNMKGLLDEVHKDFPNLTDHSIEHVDNLWRIASLITGDNYLINPLEGFILGCSFLVHDSVLSYNAFGGKDALRRTIEWTDKYQDIVGSKYDTEEGKHKIDFKVIRQLHAMKCGDILFRKFDVGDGDAYYFLEDDVMRRQYGQLIGDIASSHHWETEQIEKLPSQVNSIAIFPLDWTISPRKLACILRCADAAAIDYGRAPDYLFRLLQLNGVSKDHWVAQNRLGVSLDVHDPSRLMITSTHDFEEKDFSAWNVAYDAVRVVDEELGKCQELLTEQEQFQVNSVAGAKSRKKLASFIRTNGWMPSDVSVHISDVAHLIMTLGGKQLYGNDDLHLIVLRELIQNARDAIYARRLLEGEENFNGKITIKVCQQGEDTILSVTDNGVGMSLETISHSLLNFGSSFWHDEAVNVEFPGLKTAGFKSVGQFGIGFFSVFMIAESVSVETRKYTDGIKEAHLVKFPSGLTLAPIFANYTSSSTLYSTIVNVKLLKDYKDWPVELEAKRNKMNETNFKVPFEAMLSALVAGLDVDVYYKEFDKDEHHIHRRIDAADLDKRIWLRQLSLADYQHDKALDDYIETNYNRLRYVYDEHHKIAGLAAIGTRLLPYDDFLGGATVGGLLTGFHSRSGEHWLGVLEKYPGGAKRSGGEFRASKEILKEWVKTQLALLPLEVVSSLWTRFRLQLVMNYFRTDPKDIAVAYCMLSKKEYIMPLELLVNYLAQGKKLVFLDSDFVSNKENEGHGDSYFDKNQVASLLQEDEILYLPLMNSSFLSYKLEGGVPVSDCGFVDCLYRMATEMGCFLQFTYRNNYARNIFGMNQRALVIEVKQ